jgi:hypothetical protein
MLCLISLELTACKPSSAIKSPSITIIATASISSVESDSQTPHPTVTPTNLQTRIWTPALTVTPDIWKIQGCHVTSSSIITLEDDWLWNYSGNIEGRGKVDVLLNFTNSNGINGFYFDFEQGSQYQVSGCVENRNFTLWLHQDGKVEATIQGEFPEKDPLGNFPSSEVLNGDVLIGDLMEKTNIQTFPIYLRLFGGGAGTIEHRFLLAGVENDAEILDASYQFLDAIISDNRTQVAQMIRYPLEYVSIEKRITIQTPDMLLEQYNELFDSSFKERLARTFPDYLIAEGGNFIGIINLSVYGGGGISFDDKGWVTAIYNWQDSASSPTPTLTPDVNK